MTQLRQYRSGDEPGIRTLFEQVFGQPMSEREWQWKYRPALRDGALPMVAEEPGGAIVGHAGTVCLPGTHRGRKIRFMQICDIMVHPRARGQVGPQNLYTRMIQALFDRLAADFPGSLGYGFPGTRPFRLGEFIGYYDRVEEATACVITPLPPSLGLSVRAVPLDAPGADALWRRLHGEFPLALVRDGAYLNWRYRDHPRHEYTRLDLRRWGRLVGWAILRPLGEETAIIDILCRPTSLPVYLSAIARWLADQGRPPAMTWLPGRLGATLQGECRPTGVITTNVIRGFETPTPQVRDRLYYTMGDLDIF